MSRILIGILFAALSLGAADAAFAQKSDAALKTQALVASLAKTKYKKKEKKEVSIEVYVDIKSEAVVKSSVAEYAGVYESEGNDYRVEFAISADGQVEGKGFDFYFENENFGKPSKRQFTFRDARIEGALLTATKVYESGETKKFEAVFINQTSIVGKNPNEIESRKTAYGLGFMDVNSMFTNRVFCEYKP